ncbi:hypothetical protein ACLOJK_033914 [Asimina triloba]
MQSTSDEARSPNLLRPQPISGTGIVSGNNDRAPKNGMNSSAVNGGRPIQPIQKIGEEPAILDLSWPQDDAHSGSRSDSCYSSPHSATFVFSSGSSGSSTGDKRLHATNDSIDDSSSDHGSNVAIIRRQPQKSPNQRREPIDEQGNREQIQQPIHNKAGHGSLTQQSSRTTSTPSISFPKQQMTTGHGRQQSMLVSRKGVKQQTPKQLCGYLIRSLLARRASHKSTSYLENLREWILGPMKYLMEEDNEA